MTVLKMPNAQVDHRAGLLADAEAEPVGFNGTDTDWRSGLSIFTLLRDL